MSILTKPVEALHHLTHPSSESEKAITRTTGLLGIVVFGVAVATAISLLPDMVRYIRIKTM